MNVQNSPLDVTINSGNKKKVGSRVFNPYGKQQFRIRVFYDETLNNGWKQESFLMFNLANHINTKNGQKLKYIQIPSAANYGLEDPMLVRYQQAMINQNWEFLNMSKTDPQRNQIYNQNKSQPTYNDSLLFKPEFTNLLKVYVYDQPEKGFQVWSIETGFYSVLYPNLKENNYRWGAKRKGRKGTNYVSDLDRLNSAIQSYNGADFFDIQNGCDFTIQMDGDKKKITSIISNGPSQFQPLTNDINELGFDWKEITKPNLPPNMTLEMLYQRYADGMNPYWSDLQTVHRWVYPHPEDHLLDQQSQQESQRRNAEYQQSRQQSQGMQSVGASNFQQPAQTQQYVGVENINPNMNYTPQPEPNAAMFGGNGMSMQATPIQTQQFNQTVPIQNTQQPVNMTQQQPMGQNNVHNVHSPNPSTQIVDPTSEVDDLPF